MPVRTTLLPKSALLHVELYGTVLPGELWAALTRAYQDPGYIHGMTEVGDFRGVTDMQAGYDDMLTFTKAFTEFHNANAEPLTLFLLDQNQLGFSIGEMFMAFSETLPSTVDLHVMPGYPEIFAALDLSEDQIAEFPPHCQDETHLL
ncbi:hypothetical protein [Shimia sp.]|uniref:hypothetical protein n=1 Tax=unclassified Shimia TaxID=2630038 RepID=UPI0025D1204A|nr:hypothetical protein [Shimia sp.]MCH2068364.1 hypothetical protein [Shimia sp.]